MNNSSTDFGFQQVSPEEKTRRVGEVFTSVADNYDLMNDFMSMGLHRLWKRYAVHISRVKQGEQVLDVAAGTGDLSQQFLKLVGDTGNVVSTDINASMLNQGRDRLLDKGYLRGIDYVQADAENLPFQNESFDCVSIAFGLRNVTNKDKALASIYEKLKYGGRIIILEFSRVALPLLAKVYDQYSFNIIPNLGQWIAKDRVSYQYLVESIRKHPDQENLKHMLETAGFMKVDFLNLSGGIVAIHSGYKL